MGRLVTDNERLAEKYKRNYDRLAPLAKVALSLTHRLETTGLDNIPDGPAVYVANHNSRLDPLFLALALHDATGEPLRFLTKDGYLKGHGIDDKGKFGRTVQLVTRATGQIPVDRQARGDTSSIEAAVMALNEQQAKIGIFPEGTLAQYGTQLKFHKGAAKIALSAGGEGVPIVPVGIVPKRRRMGRTAMRLSFGEAIDTTGYYQGIRRLLPGHSKIGLLTHELEDRVAELTGFEKTGKYGKPGQLRAARRRG